MKLARAHVPLHETEGNPVLCLLSVLPYWLATLTGIGVIVSQRCGASQLLAQE